MQQLCCQSGRQRKPNVEKHMWMPIDVKAESCQPNEMLTMAKADIFKPNEMCKWMPIAVKAEICKPNEMCRSAT